MFDWTGHVQAQVTCRQEIIEQWFPTIFDPFLPLLSLELFIPPPWIVYFGFVGEY